MRYAETRTCKKTFNKGSANEVILYRDLNVEIHDGEFVTIIGSNGSGKINVFQCYQREYPTGCRKCLL